jgi:hypothetical protein
LVKGSSPNGTVRHCAHGAALCRALARRLGLHWAGGVHPWAQRCRQANMGKPAGGRGRLHGRTSLASRGRHPDNLRWNNMERELQQLRSRVDSVSRGLQGADAVSCVQQGTAFILLLRFTPDSSFVFAVCLFAVGRGPDLGRGQRRAVWSTSGGQLCCAGSWVGTVPTLYLLNGPAGCLRGGP